MIKLPERQKALFKLAVWTSLVVWMVFFFAFSVVLARKAAVYGPYLFGSSTWGQVMTFVLPVWMIFTAMLIVALSARWARRKLAN